MTAIRNFVWYDLTTPDRAAAEAFYAAVVGWSMADSGMPGGGYTLAKVGERPVAGMMSPQPGCDGPEQYGWIGYVGVDDVAATIARAEASGGRTLVGPMEVPEVGPFAVIADAQGAALGLFAPAMAMEPIAPMTPGAIAWHELSTTDGPAAFAFHSDLFGWTKDQAMPMGEMGVYQLFAAGAGAIGGMMTNPQAPMPAWLYYFGVDDIDAAIERVGAAGGKIMHGPMDVPGGAHIVHATDPQNIYFALVGPRRRD